MEEFDKILELVKRKHKIDIENNWGTSGMFLEALREEICEAEEEIKLGKRVYLEDELGDVLWNYIHLLHKLENENKIEIQKVFERCSEKYDERVSGIENGEEWRVIKERQKIRLKEEQESF